VSQLYVQTHENFCQWKQHGARPVHCHLCFVGYNIALTNFKHACISAKEIYLDCCHNPWKLLAMPRHLFAGPLSRCGNFCVRLLQHCCEYSHLHSFSIILSARSSRCCHWVDKVENMLTTTTFGDCTRYGALRWQRHSETTAISILCSKRAASFFFPMFKCRKKCTFCSFCTSIYASQLSGNFKKAYMQRLRVPIILDAELYTTCPGERVLVVIRFNATFLPLRPYWEKNVYLFLERCRNSINVWLRPFMQTDCLYSSLFFEHYSRILLCDWVLGRYSVCLRAHACHSTFVLYLALTRVGPSVLLWM